MCMFDDTKEIIVEYKNIYDYKGNKQAWKMCIRDRSK